MEGTGNREHIDNFIHSPPPKNRYFGANLTSTPNPSPSSNPRLSPNPNKRDRELPSLMHLVNQLPEPSLKKFKSTHSLDSEKELTKLQAQFQRVIKENEKQKLEINELNKEIDLCDSAIGNLNTELNQTRENFRKEVDSHNNTIGNLDLTIRELRYELELKNKKLASTLTHFDKLSSTNRTLNHFSQEIYAAYDRTINERDWTINELVKENRELKQKNNSLEKGIVHFKLENTDTRKPPVYYTTLPNFYDAKGTKKK